MLYEFFLFLRIRLIPDGQVENYKQNIYKHIFSKSQRKTLDTDSTNVLN